MSQACLPLKGLPCDSSSVPVIPWCCLSSGAQPCSAPLQAWRGLLAGWLAGQLAYLKQQQQRGGTWQCGRKDTVKPQQERSSPFAELRPCRRGCSAEQPLCTSRAEARPAPRAVQGGSSGAMEGPDPRGGYSSCLSQSSLANTQPLSSPLLPWQISWWTRARR